MDETKLVNVREAPTERDMSATTETISIGQWYWVRNSNRPKLNDFDEQDPEPFVEPSEPEDEDESKDESDVEAGDDEAEEPTPPASRWLGCVVEIGTNYAKLEGVNGCSWRVHFDRWDRWCTPELLHADIIQRKIKDHSGRVSYLLDEVKRVTALLGIAPRIALNDSGVRLPEDQNVTLAVAHEIADIKAHQLALVEAKDKTLPELFKRVKREHELMASWMKADLIVAKADLNNMQKAVDVIDDRIFTVQLYAGLVEELALVRKGEPADNDAKVHLFQRRHYMDEECLARYQAGGMEFKDIKAFDKWLARKENLKRILPFERSIVAFRVRRNVKERNNLDAFVQFNLERADKITFLYIRNGEQLWRLITEINFGAQLFPNREESDLLSDGKALYADVSWSRVDKDKIITEDQYLYIVEQREEREREREAYKRDVWSKLTPKEQAKRWHESPRHKFDSFSDTARWERVNKDSVWYDDVMREIARAALEHNRVATVLQGLLDRSEALHPHPPYRLWTAEGFQAGLVLVYDDSKTITPGPAVDFETYRHRLNQSIKAGSMTIGQEDLWERHEAMKENARREARGRGRYETGDHTHYRPYGNAGPGYIAKIRKLRGDRCLFVWERERERRKWVNNPARPGWLKKDETLIGDQITVPVSCLFNVSAYTPGDFHMFYDDPRTRAQYLQWAPFLLAAEDYHAGKYDKETSVRHVPLGKLQQIDRDADEGGEAEDED